MHMNFSVGTGRITDIRQVAQLARTADQCGYSRISFPDTPAFNRDVHVMMTVAALNTHRIHIGQGFTDPFTFHPFVIANATATIDELFDDQKAVFVELPDLVRREFEKHRASFLQGRPSRYLFTSRSETCQMNLFHSSLLHRPWNDAVLPSWRQTAKEAGTAQARAPWHQDHAYYPLHGTQVINCWTALDAIPIETALVFWKGSHADGYVYRAVDSGGDSDYGRVQRGRPSPSDIDDDRAAEVVAAAQGR